MLRFLADNRRWLATGLLLAFGSSFGQTWFISLFAGEIRAEYGLSDGDWGLIYTVATLSSAALLLGRGSWADTVKLSRLAPLIAATFAGAALLMAFGTSVWMLGVAVFLLRFCGQGMFSHIKMTAMARWFVATRGRAMALTNLGYPLGEVLLPLPAVLVLGAIGWRASWLVVAAVIALVVLPSLVRLLAQDRAPQGTTGTTGAPGIGGLHWTRREALRHWLFWALAPLMLTPGFIGTVIFFHQVHIAEVKGWSLVSMAPGYPAYAASTVGMAFVTGWAADRFGPARLLPVMVLPMALGIALIGPAETPLGWIVALAIIGVTQGMSTTTWGTLLPAIYGTNHLGSVRSLATALMVVSTAIGPGLTGVAIDWGIPFPDQGIVMAIWCVALSAGMVAVLRKLAREA
ncbi:MFS transporter [Roseibacterium sp. SDUM158017]|uniref:MFS transporter n=1 Tax=Roseicyclus salinarum TaxID=3036773 RepID=UPI0024153948|nr:MFS transporter [Roseibacterium sp. SDUM158017]MDG4649431.1 MFS transporter [Roseibacterium sp. SDUM158017]